MGFAIIIAVLVLSCWLLVATFRRLRRRHAGRSWWFAFGGLVITGVALGYWLAFYAEYQVSPTFRFFSFPIPLCFFHLENGQWVDFPTPEFVRYPGIATNIVAVTALVVLPVLVASLFRHRGRQG